jgi:hypothetical protein
MRRRYAAACSALLLSLCVATVGLMVRSHRYSDDLCFTRIVANPAGSSNHTYVLSFAGGSVGVGVVRISPSMSPAGFRWDVNAATAFQPRNTLERLGFWHIRANMPALAGTIIETSADAVPIWLPMGLFMLAALVRMYQFARQVRETGCCNRCSYDLTGNTSGTCPECGTATSEPCNDLGARAVRARIE